MKKKKAVILHSGGLDSTYCLLKARSSGREVLSLGIDYGQRHRIELEYAQYQCTQYGVERRVLKVEWDRRHLEIPLGRTVAEMSKSVSPAFLPGRNGLFLALACAEAAGIGASEVWIGINAVDFSGYPDCRPAFLEAFSAMTRLAIPGGPKVVAPILKKTKPEIAKAAMKLGIKRGDVWCCYRPQLDTRGIVACGRCDACLLHEHAWVRAMAPRQSSK
jgi:7-cyano-7-deazaguanine synthase